MTHDQAEAFALGDRVAVMRAGSIVQTGTADELWARPADADVARFLGLTVRDGMAIRPEAVYVKPVGAEDGEAIVESAVRHGPTVRLVLRLDDGSTLAAAVSDIDHPLPGDRVSVDVDPAGIVDVTDDA